MTLSIPIPDNLDKASIDELNQVLREYVAVRLYREGKLSHGKFAKFLGIGRGQADEILGRYGVVDMTPDELGREFASIRRLGA
jgi:predicted HTH domain antitoxin